jgi:PIN domain nuclease of toxin-antitoxin system
MVVAMRITPNSKTEEKHMFPYRKFLLSVCLFMFFAPVLPIKAQKKFVHPGVTMSKAQLDFIKAKVNAGQEPWISGWNKMMSYKESALTYQPKPCQTVGFNVCQVIRLDGAAVYSHALQYYIKGNRANAEKAREIVNAWAAKNTNVLPNGSGGGCLISSWGFPRMVAGAEILRAAYPEWTADEKAKFSNYLNKVVFDKSTNCNADNNNHEISGFANGLMMAIFLDDNAKYQKMLKNLTDFVGIYIMDSKGCTNESDRDQPHTMMGIGFLAWGAEAAHHQGDDDVYNALNKRLYTSYEYVAKYNLGQSVDESGCQKRISSDRRGSVGHTIWEVAYNHYHNRLKLPMPWTEQYVKKMRPEQLPDQEMPWATMTHAEVGNLDGTSPSPVTSFRLQLQQGWNLISTPLKPSNTRVESLLSQIDGKYAAVYAFNGTEYQEYIPGSASNSLSEIEPGRGYWIYMESGGQLEIQGEPASNSIQLKTGWNLAGYNSTKRSTVESALESIRNQYSVIYSYDPGSNSYKGNIPGIDNSLTELEPGKGYWIYADRATVWMVP